MSPPASLAPNPMQNPLNANPYIEVRARMDYMGPYGSKLLTESYCRQSNSIPEMRKMPAMRGKYSGSHSV